jgi:hypothetical protein
MLEHLPVASQVGKTVVGGIDLNKPWMRQAIEALIALSPSPNGFTASDVAARVRAISKQTPSQYGPRHAAYDLKKLRGKQILRRIAHSRRYEPLPTGLRAMTALLVLRNKAIKPLLAAACNALFLSSGMKAPSEALSQVITSVRVTSASPSPVAYQGGRRGGWSD